MSSPTPTKLSTAQLITTYVATAQAKTPAGEPMPWLLRKPSDLADLVWGVLTDAAKGGALVTMWALYLIPIGLPPLTWWAAFMIAFCTRWIFPMMPNPAYVLYSLRQDDEEQDPSEAAAEALMHHCTLLAAFLFALGAWALLAFVSLF